MPHNEFLQWVSYLTYKKPDVQEQQMAVLITTVVNAMGGKAKVTDYLISHIQEQKPKKLDATALRGLFSVPTKP